MTEQLQLIPGKRIIVSENLTAMNHKLFKDAMRMKFDEKLAKVYTKNGLVGLEKLNDSKPILIRSTHDLDLYTVVAATSLQSTSNNNNTYAVPNGSTITTPTQAQHLNEQQLQQLFQQQQQLIQQQQQHVGNFNASATQTQT